MQPRTSAMQLQVLFLQEGKHWVAQCLNKDIAAQGETIDEAKQSLIRSIIGQIIVDFRHGIEPLSTIDEAPKFYWESGVRDDAATRRAGKSDFTKLKPAKQTQCGFFDYGAVAEWLCWGLAIPHTPVRLRPAPSLC